MGGSNSSSLPGRLQGPTCLEGGRAIVPVFLTSACSLVSDRKLMVEGLDLSAVPCPRTKISRSWESSAGSVDVLIFLLPCPNLWLTEVAESNVPKVCGKTQGSQRTLLGIASTEQTHAVGNNTLLFPAMKRKTRRTFRRLPRTTQYGPEFCTQATRLQSPFVLRVWCHPDRSLCCKLVYLFRGKAAS